MAVGDVFQFIVADEFVNRLQRLSYEYDMRADICQRIVSRSADLDLTALAHYERMTLESKVVLGEAKNHFAEACVMPMAEKAWGVGANVSWEIPDYRTKVCVVRKR